MKTEEVKHCSFQNWYNDFKQITIKSIILQLPDGFPEYILKDGIVLPESSGASYAVDNNSSDDSSSEDEWECSNTKEAEPPNFVEFDRRIKDAINTLGGKVFPKLNWSSPRDASWIAVNNSCCCTSVSDIYLLLKSSDFIVHDLTKVFSHCEDYNHDEKLVNSLSQPREEFYLVLRKWIEIDTSGEYRCFVKDSNLIGISQRENSLYFDHIHAYRDSIVEDIVSFFKENIQHRFFCSDYVFDVYRIKQSKVRLLDFNPFGIVTDALLFSWDELTDESFLNQNNCLPVFRYVDENHGVQPRPLMSNGIPKDFLDISTGEDSFKLFDLINLKIEQRDSSSNDDEENVIR